MKSISLDMIVVVAVAFLPMTQAGSDESEKTRTAATDPMQGKEAGQVRDDNGLKMKLVWCPPGKFMMGSPESEDGRNEDEQQASVSLTKGSWLGRYEVTQAEWERVMGTSPWKGKMHVKEGGDYPATFISWEQAIMFCTKFTLQERTAGRLPEAWRYTLPTEAEWEYACRAGTTTRYSSGTDASRLGDSSWTLENTEEVGEEFAHRVGQKNPNEWGLYDMHANVWEWCLDRYVHRLLGGADPEGWYDGLVRVIRGGGWTNAAVDCRSAFRSRGHPSVKDECLGFRVALSAARQVKQAKPGAEAATTTDK